MDFLRNFSERHEALKKRIHSFRLPLSAPLRAVMGLIYFSIPVIGGYYIMQAAIGQSEKNLGAHGERLRTASGGQTSEYSGATADQKKALQMLLDRHRPKE
jgi:hypothetical protein